METNPTLITTRVLKNLGIAGVFILAGIISFLSTKSIYMSIIPLLFGLGSTIATGKMFYDYANGLIICITAVCIHKETNFIGGTTYIMTGFEGEVSEDLTDGFNFTLNGMKRADFSVAGTYELLFRKNINGLIKPNLIDFRLVKAQIPASDKGEGNG